MKQCDFDYKQTDSMFTAFFPNTREAEKVWNEIAAQNGGDFKILTIHAKAIIKQLRDKGYSVRKQPKSAAISDDELLAEFSAAV